MERRLEAALRPDASRDSELDERLDASREQTRHLPGEQRFPASDHLGRSLGAGGIREGDESGAQPEVEEMFQVRGAQTTGLDPEVEERKPNGLRS
jgi:hypothetical protein